MTCIEVEIFTAKLKKLASTPPEMDAQAWPRM